MSYALLRAELGRKVYSGWWTGGTVYEPGATVNFPEPAVGRDASCLAWEYDIPEAERLTMGGTDQIKGELRLGIWIESNSADVLEPGFLDAADGEFSMTQSPDGAVTFLKPVPGVSYPRGAWRGREVIVPFIYLEEHSS